MILGELGRDPIYLFTVKLHLSYIVRSLQTSENRYINIISKYQMQFNIGWAKWYKDTATRLSIMVPTRLSKEIISQTNTHLLEAIKLDEQVKINDNITNAQKHLYYKCIKGDTNEIKSYLVTNFCLDEMKIIAGVRCEALSLNGRPWANIDDENCKMCNLNVREDVIHMFGECSFYKDLRQIFFGKSILLYEECISEFMNEIKYHRLAKFVKNVLIKRNNQLGN